MGKDGMRSKDAYSPAGDRPTGSATGGTPRTDYPTFDDKQPFVLSQCEYKPPKPRRKGKPDVLVSQYDEVWSEMRTEELGRKVHYFKVFNETKGHEYTTELMEGVRGEPLANCNCPSAVPCKHILHCLMKVLGGIDPGFGAAEKHCEFMVGLRICPPFEEEF